MRMRTILLVALALICGGSAAIGVSQLVGNTGDSGNSDGVAIVVATADVPRGTLITTDSIRLQRWPESLVPSGAFTSLEEVENRLALVPLVAGEPVSERKLTDSGAGQGLSAMIPNGMRALTIKAGHVAAGVAGFIMPGDKVDVLLTTNGRGRNDVTGGGATTTLLQNVQVLAVDQRLDAVERSAIDPKDLRSVTLLVTPNQAAKLDLGMNKGILHLSLRNPEDNEEADTLPATMAQLQFHQEPPTEPPTLVAVPGGLFVSASVSGDEGAVAPQAGRRRQAIIATLRGTHRGEVRIDRAP